MSDATDALATACQALTEAIRQSALDPADAATMLMSFIASAPIASDPDPVVMAAQQATAAIMRRSAFVSLAIACADYNPASSTEAQGLLSQVTGLFDIEAVAAADAGEQDVYRTLRALRSAVAKDLSTRGANLPALVTVTTPHSEPSMVLAYRLYDDAYREPGLVARADAIHPLFMPTSFEALSS
jgi:prophage DNA circulation protein